MENYKNTKIENFLDVLSSTKSMPGGGTASALTAALGISLTIKVCALSLGKEKYKEYENLILDVKSKSEELKILFLNLMDEDAFNFKEMEKVYTMPKTTDDEKKMRKIAIENAAKTCCIVPKKIIENSLYGISLTSSLYEKSNASAKSDLIIGNTFLRTAIDGAWQNILINLSYINDDKFLEEYDEFGKIVLKELG